MPSLPFPDRLDAVIARSPEHSAGLMRTIILDRVLNDHPALAEEIVTKYLAEAHRAALRHAAAEGVVINDPASGEETRYFCYHCPAALERDRTATRGQILGATVRHHCGSYEAQCAACQKWVSLALFVERPVVAATA